ncbi:peptidoglycan DD-metalloendopeptidase family protein [Chromobacterium subtsugae]|uniref:Peptidoglycan DD-metalloendopeptidase family protein n=1 Tax=Chromobacterium subtsugae TaxID=251747 RepID=A0ABS7FFX5_9NEIS|nr:MULTISPECIES: peptidoglycan DD-metalloendopeptidase family protein [Chromobacterium]MBW7567749.1 peptidoglycan DD-metalloendopeptidase family protein [Chromobacterium subtsugae]MBW8288975.1 peptidoglycan DD-metalloendopeptidase family protein [Chromobacterium subtsugae]WSE91232.1 peptidoglycan DD-metalloendopeptidase family protein [Chromobacterium subtsugae]WVH59607.1 peptidoglycan DD-metalloendopeptidase family protein [Chromobacterium subtsugae]
MTEDNDFHVFVATIYGEAAGQSTASWQAIANVIMNRIKQGREWKKYKTPADIVKNTGFDAYTQKNKPYQEAYNYLANGTSTPHSGKIDLLKSTVAPIYTGNAADNAQRAVLYYSPKAQEKLYKKAPSWNFSLLEEVQVSGAEKDDFKFFRYKDVAKLKVRVRRVDHPIANREVKFTVGKVEKHLKTNKDGELPVILTDKIGEQFKLWVKNSKGELVKVYDEAITAAEIAIDIIRNKIAHNSQTEKHIGKPIPKSTTSHIVKKGETLSKIAMLYSTSIAEICQANKIKNPNSIAVGQELKLPQKKNKETPEKKSAKIAPPSTAHSTHEVLSHRNEDGHPNETVGKTKPDSTSIAKILFPIAGHNRKSYKPGTPGEFGHNRPNSRKHAGCDIYAAVGTPIRAVADGKVVFTHGFYWKTNEVSIDHDGFIVRYGEVDPESIAVKVGDTVKRGQTIAKVGQLIMPSGEKYKQCMLHFEMYNSSDSVIKATLSNSSKPFRRRSDLINPTATLDAADD